MVVFRKQRADEDENSQPSGKRSRSSAAVRGAAGTTVIYKFGKSRVPAFTANVISVAHSPA